MEYLIRKSINDLAHELDPQKFWQINRSSIFNVKSIEVAREDFRGRYTVFVKGIKAGLKASDPYRYSFRQMWKLDARVEVYIICYVLYIWSTFGPSELGKVSMVEQQYWIRCGIE